MNYRTIDCNGWVKIANSNEVRSRIANENSFDDFNCVIDGAKKLVKEIDWESAVLLSCAVYAWMPTMIRTIDDFDKEKKNTLVNLLGKVAKNEVLSESEIQVVKDFANRSIVGASKLLHVINPSMYPIWDSRVAKVFILNGLNRYLYVDKYVDYFNKLNEWVKCDDVLKLCGEVRDLNSSLKNVSNIRILELVLFRAKK